MGLWEEALDVDDSDLRPPPSLRPCKQQRRTDQTNSITAAASTTATTYISQPQTLDSSPSASQTVSSPPQNLDSTYHDESPPQSHTIPGPAGIIQAAKLRKTRDIENRQGQEGDLMATQEYIRKVVEDPNEDDDFKRNPWLSAIEFLYDNGSMFYSACDAPLGEINKYQNNGKLDQVVAVIKSCTPNELGDMTVTLKDPTGTVSGTVHHKVFTEGDIRKGVCVGSVLVLHKVSVFSPSRSTHYLNVTKKNLVKVFYKDGGSSQKQTFHETIDVAPHSAPNNSIHISSQDSGRGTPILGSAFSLERGTEGITNRMKRSNTNNEQENRNYSQTSNKGIAEEIIKEADVREKSQNVEQLSEGHTQALLHGWTDEQLELLACDDF
ncbi:hypothetical protein SSX86_019949 [Deinandra increscens subsp. villosa]|uniref:Homologous recombination OB-fold protein OB-fold domain-containing protein n=1 Tax=Deinandra increscens subsp. villosa TaxID=3103831 RepID=A0AAP0GW19_9ASTR